MPAPTYGLVGAPRENRMGRSWKQNESRGRIITRSWEVETDSPLVGPVRVVTLFQEATGLAVGKSYAFGTAPDPAAHPPVAGDPWYERDTGTYVTDIEASPTGDEGMSWKVTVTYGPPASGEPKPANPLDEPEQLDYDAAQWERVADQDIEGNAIWNTAGDPFDPPLMLDDTRPTFTISRNQAAFDPAEAYAFRDYLNADVFFGWAARCVKLGVPKAQRLWSQDAPDDGYYWRVTYPFYVNPETWDRVVLNAGRRQLVGGTRRAIIVDGAPVADPVPLSEAGAALAPNATPFFKVFQLYKTGDFTVFGFTGA